MEDYYDFTVTSVAKGQGCGGSIKQKGKKKENPYGHITSKHIRERERKIEYSSMKK